MSAVLGRTGSLKTAARSPGVWAAAWIRLKQDPMGLGALGIVLAFLVLILVLVFRPQGLLGERVGDRA